MAVEKKFLKEILNHFGKDLLKSYMNSKGLTGLSKSKNEILEKVFINSTSIELIKFISLNLSKIRNHVALFEIDDINNKLSESDIIDHHTNSTANFSELTHVILDNKFQMVSSMAS